MNSSLIKRFKDFVFHKKIFSKGDGVIVGISGGADSICLTLLLKLLQKKYQLRIKLIHVNYGTRGDDSRLDEEFVKSFAEKVSLPLKVFYFEGNRSTGNVEEIFRNFRYERFEEERKREEFNWIAVGHNLDDQVETFFMNLFRGSGMSGLGSVGEKRERVVRPLVVFTKKEIISFLNNKKQDFRLDQTNDDTKLFRNRIRKELIPLIEQNYSSQIKERVANLSENIRRGNELISEVVNSCYNEMVVISNVNERVLDLKKIKGLSSASRSFVFRKLIEDLKGSVSNISSKHFFEFEKILSSKKSKNQEIVIGGILLKIKSFKLIARINI